MITSLPTCTTCKKTRRPGRGANVARQHDRQIATATVLRRIHELECPSDADEEKQYTTLSVKRQGEIAFCYAAVDLPPSRDCASPSRSPRVRRSITASSYLFASGKTRNKPNNRTPGREDPFPVDSGHSERLTEAASDPLRRSQRPVAERSHPNPPLTPLFPAQRGYGPARLLLAGLSFGKKGKIGNMGNMGKAGKMRRLSVFSRSWPLGGAHADSGSAERRTECRKMVTVPNNPNNHGRTCDVSCYSSHTNTLRPEIRFYLGICPRNLRNLRNLMGGYFRRFSSSH